MKCRVLSSLPLLVCVLFFFVGSPQLKAQTTIPNIDDDPVSAWLWCNSCASNNGNTNAVGGVAKVTQSGYTVDGQSVRFDLIKNCTSPCGYGNVFFYNVLTHNISETAVTIDMYAMMDSAGNANSQAVEFTVEHDICKVNCGLSNEEDFRYIFSLQCDFVGGQWNVWDGAAYSTGGNGWQPAGHACVRFQAMSFNHFIFHFTRQNQNVTYVDMWINGTQYSINKQYGIQYDTPNYHQQFLASVQLDGDSTQGAYSLWVDKWNVTYQ
jgi:hypothetical protein